MLDFAEVTNNTWNPPEISDENLITYYSKNLPIGNTAQEYLVIFKTEPYIDSLYVHLNKNEPNYPLAMKRFSFHEGFQWPYTDERFFIDNCLKNPRCNYNPSEVDDIYKFYSKHYPDWKLKRYYTKSMRLLDHIYHCMRQGTAKEMLYKAGLDELAANIEDLDEINLLSTKPSELYDGISMRVLRSLNCRDGSHLLSTASNRAFIRDLQMRSPDIFGKPFNNAQCRYLNFLISGNLTAGDAGRLFKARCLDLSMIWCRSQYEMFIYKETQNKRILADVTLLENIDPIYKDYISKLDLKSTSIPQGLQTLRYYLLSQREEYDVQIRLSNRNRNPDWQERNQGYVVRYPQTINDFCREAIYMRNCLLTYVDAFINNDTTVLFMRKTDSFNTPFITIEICNNELMQAYHRFNENCKPEEIAWIQKYCARHGIESVIFPSK